MKILHNIYCTGLFLMVFYPLFCAADDNIHLDISVTRNGELISKPSVIVENGKQVDLSVSDQNNASRTFKMFVTASRSAAADTDKSNIANIDILFFEPVNGELVLRGAPSATVTLDQPATFTLAAPGLLRKAPTYEITVTHTDSVNVSQTDCQRAQRFIGNFGTPMSDICSSLPLTSYAFNLLGIGNANASVMCCSASCGSTTLTCCGTVSCCDRMCGACCQSPQTTPQ